jgi:hypothetical protein
MKIIIPLYLTIITLALLVTTYPVEASSSQNYWPPLPTGPISRIAFGSCAKQWQHQPIWDTVIAAQPDLFLFIGDAVYADTDGKTAWSVSEMQLKGEGNRLADKPEFQRVRSKLNLHTTHENRMKIIIVGAFGRIGKEVDKALTDNHEIVRVGVRRGDVKR